MTSRSSAPEIDVDELFSTSSTDANRAASVWLLARGLQAELGDLRASEDGTLRPCPDITATMALLADLTSSAVTAADTVRERVGRSMTAANAKKILAAADETATYTADAEAVLRRLFLAVVGVAAGYPDSPQVSRVDRAAVDQWVLAGEYPKSFGEDGIDPMSATLDEFEAELSGIIARLILDGESALLIDLDTDDDDADTIVILPVEDGSVVYITSAEGAEPEAHPDPVHPAHIAAHLVEAMRELGGPEVESLERVGVTLVGMFGMGDLGAFDDEDDDEE